MTNSEIAKKLLEMKFNAYRSGVGYLPLIHWVNTVRAHLRGRIHARRLGKVCTYDPPVRREGNHTGYTYPLTRKVFHYEIDSLEAQAAFIGKEVLALF